MRVLSIDAWRYDGGWTWNNWFHVGDVEDAPEKPREFLAMLRREGFLSKLSAGKLAVEDDGYNIVVLEKGSRRPILAVVHGF
jgi:hypothetical protein